MTDIIFRLDGSRVLAVDPEFALENTYEPFVDLILSFDEAGKFVTAQLVKRNEEQTSSEVESN